MLASTDSGETHGLPLRPPLVFASMVVVLLAAPAIRAQEPPQEPDAPPTAEPTPQPTPEPTPEPQLAPPPAVDRTPREWHPKKELHTGTGDWIVIGAGAAAALGAAIVPPQSKHPRGGVLYDEGARDALRLKSRWWRYAVRDMSDVGVSLETTWPFLVDALVSAWYWRGNTKVARDIVLVDAEAFVLAAAVQGWTNGLVARERPFGRLCGSEIPEASVDCEDVVRYRSFFSGHATLSFTAAGVMCTNHLEMELLGAPWDVVTCAGAVGVAAMTATFRVMSDMHYATDATVGALVGTGFGLLIPWLHYRGESSDVHVGAVGQGLGLVGVF